jgi:hypothetical protein
MNAINAAAEPALIMRHALIVSFALSIAERSKSRFASSSVISDVVYFNQWDKSKAAEAQPGA